MNIKSFICIVAAIFSLTACGKSKDQIAEENRQNEVKAQEEALKAKMNRYQQQLLNKLLDPSSAQFKNLRLVNGGNGEALCGEVNSKNSFGGYTGYSSFAVTERPYSDGANIAIESGGDAVTRMVSDADLTQAGCR